MENRVRSEEGFTLIELMVVVLIIGVLAAIALPLVRKNIKTAVMGTLVADVREAAVQMEKDATLSATGNYATAMSDEYHNSASNNIVLLENDYSDDSAFCIIGRNDNYKDLYVYYSSEDRIVTTTANPTGDCGTGTSYPGGIVGGEGNVPEVLPPGAQPSPPIGYSDSKRKKYTICHNGNALNLPLPGIINGHAGHNSDIIPPIPNAYPTGLNWTVAGAATWYNNCVA